MRDPAGLVRNRDGRVRLGWRLLLFLLLLVAILAVTVQVPLRGIPGETAPFLVASVAAGWFVLRLDGRQPGALGFYLSRSAVREAVVGLALGAGLAAATVGLIAATGGLRWEVTAVSLGTFVGAGLGSLWLFAIPAAAEEALFRGYPLQALAETWGPGVALMLTSLAFALLHLGNPEIGAMAVGNILAAGLLLGAVYLRTGSLWCASGVHLGWNWAHGFGAGLPVSGLDLVDNPLLEAAPRGPAWLSGDAFGPEGSVVTTLTLLAGAAALWWGPWLRPSPAALAAEPLALRSAEVPLRGAPSATGVE